MLTKEKLNEIKLRVAKTTPGPWEVTNGTDVFTQLGAKNKESIRANHNDGWYIAKCNEGTTTVEDDEIELSFAEQNANSHFIANSREDIPLLITEIERIYEAIKLIKVIAEPHAEFNWAYEKILNITNEVLEETE